MGSSHGLAEGMSAPGNRAVRWAVQLAGKADILYSWMLQIPMHQSLSRLISQQRPHVSLIIERYLCPLEAGDETQLAVSFPAANVVSISFVAAFSTNVKGLHSLLREASRIQSITMTSQRGRFNPASGLLPAIKCFSVPVDRWRIEGGDVSKLCKSHKCYFNPTTFVPATRRRAPSTVAINDSAPLLTTLLSHTLLRGLLSIRTSRNTRSRFFPANSEPRRLSSVANAQRFSIRPSSKTIDERSLSRKDSVITESISLGIASTRIY